MDSVGDGLDNSVVKSFFTALQTELLDRSAWTSRADLEQATFAFIEGFYNPRRHHSTLDHLSPNDYKNQRARQLASPAA